MPLEVHGSNFEALGAPCPFLGVLWVAGLPGGAQNELIELPVRAAAPIYRDSVDSGGGGLELRGVWQPVGRESGPYKKILVRFGSILPGLMDAWILPGLPGLMPGCFGLLGRAVCAGIFPVRA